MKIVHTSDGPAVLMDDGSVAMASDYEAMKDLARNHKATLVELIEAQVADVVRVQVVAADMEKAAVTVADQRTLVAAERALMGLMNVSNAMLSVAQSDPQEESK